MGVPLLQKRASDLLDAFVGGTEHKIAGAFAEARDTGAFLMFDEADSLLQERAHAVRSWEISEVNEMLT
jgi:transitional endoplasmic reticulum ATPase